MLDVCENTFGETCLRKHNPTEARPCEKEHILIRNVRL
jgi:hypothetical protein